MKRYTLLERLELPRGFQAAGVSAGLKKSRRKDMAVILSELPAAMAGVFTTNQVQAAPVRLCRERLAGGAGRAIVINSGNANTCNGRNGRRDAERMATLAGGLLGVDSRQVFVCSTGRIGVPLPMETIERGIHALAGRVSARGGNDAARAIMTTDTRLKVCTVRFRADQRLVTLSALAKGAGMIEPHMATMLAFFLTDAAVRPAAMQAALGGAVADSFNRITVDGDQSTNDTVLVMANGAAGNRPLRPGHPDWPVFEAALREATLNLALKMVRDGEGARKLITVRVLGARTAGEADAAARAVANSLLVKTAWAGEYPNWGRVMDALGYSPARVVEEKVDLHYDHLLAVRHGVAAYASLEALKRVQRKPFFTLCINLNLGRGAAVVYTCDCTEEYVRINR